MTLLIAFLIWSMPQEPASAPKQVILEQISCGPSALPAPAAGGLRVLGGNVHGRIMFGAGDAVILNAGTSQGVQKGQQYFVRRPVNDPATKQPKVGALYGVHTSGWITVVDAKDTMAVATVTHTCDAVMGGDYLEPYADPVPPQPALTGAPDFEHPGRIFMADDHRLAGSARQVMLMNRGSADGIRGGQVVTLFRETLNGLGPIIDLGRGTVLSVSPQSALVRIDSSRDAIYLGDLVAIHRITP